MNQIAVWRTIRAIAACLWVVFLLQSLTSFSYYARLFSITLYFTESLGMSDASATSYYMWFGAASVIFSVLAGPVVDQLGLKRSMLLGVTALTVAGFVFAFSQNIPLTAAALLGGIPLGTALLEPPMHISINRYSSLKVANKGEADEVEKMGFRFIYIAANLGAALALVFTSLAVGNPANDSGNASTSAVPLNCSRPLDFFAGDETVGLDSLDSDDPWFISGYALLFAVAAVVTLVSVFVVWAFEEVRLPQASAKFSFREFLGTARETRFYVLLLFVASLVPVRATFKYLEALMPIYIRRTQPCAPYGLLLAVNPLSIVPLVAVMAPATRRVPLFVLLIAGTFVAGAAPLLLTFWTEAPYYSNIWVAVLLQTIGEAAYSPLISLYIMKMSPPNKKGLYGGLLKLPEFLGNFAAGKITAWALAEYCPPGGDPEQCHGMWVPLSLISLISFVLLTVLYVILYPVCKFRDEEEEVQGYSQQLDQLAEGSVESSSQESVVRD